ncbi:caspase domain-containing protein [Kordia periserrulae]|uniref:Caspase domain-containing protein n=1 Tax=Kordia periserrulae TaxID=701523 RepID=A0A2T6BU44_9FLAO|nr:caspase family protein [Kordia periserrulae]PTX59546.1 caspase domain-containing protein [Kordia periserrulae]
MKAYSLHIGLNYIDQNHYSWDGRLKACVNDATDMEYIMSSLGYQTKKLLNENATRENVTKYIKELANKSKTNDIVVITYSGHGSVKPDFNSDEDDDLDETWCLYDGELIDDELRELWTLFKDKTRIVFISDSCFSGDVVRMHNNPTNDLQRITNINIVDNKLAYKSTPWEIAHTTYYRNKEFYDLILNKKQMIIDKDIKASIISISASLSNEPAYEGFFNGEFTNHLKKVWNGGKFSGNYRQFHRLITKSITRPQTPEIKYIGRPNPKFYKQSPFQVK